MHAVEIAKLTSGRRRRSSPPRTPAAPATTPEGQKLERTLLELKAQNELAAKQNAAIMRERELAAARQWALNRLADLEIKKHGWPPSQDGEFREILSCINELRDHIAAAYQGR